MSEASEKEVVETLDIEQIIGAIPHRYPFLMIETGVVVDLKVKASPKL